MKTVQQFRKRIELLRSRVKQEKVSIPGGRSDYFVKSVDDKFVIILQGKTLQKHKIEQLESLFTKGYFFAPQKKIKYDRDTKTGHLRMKNAIVDYLEVIY
jgi:hypothetical protein